MSVRYRKSLITALCATWVVVCSAASSEKYETVRLSDPNWKYVVQGVFSRAATFFPGDGIFYVSLTHASLTLPYKSVSVEFLGRTGEKSFELLQSEKDGTTPVPPKKVPVYFERGAMLPFQVPMLVPGCEGAVLNISLRMLKLEGNALEVETVAPQCLFKRAS